MGLIYSANKSDKNLEENKIVIEDDFVKIKKPEKPILFLNNYITKKHLPIIYESFSDIEDDEEEYDVDLLTHDKKKMLDDVSGV